MLSVKQGGIKYHFLNLWYDSTWDWNLISRTVGENESLSELSSLFPGKLGFIYNYDHWCSALSAGVVEYAECISPERHPPSPMSRYDTKPFDGEAPVQNFWEE